MIAIECYWPYTLLLILSALTCAVTVTGKMPESMVTDAAGIPLNSLRSSNRSLCKMQHPKSIWSMEPAQLELNKPLSVHLRENQTKMRFHINLMHPSPLRIAFSQRISCEIYFNGTGNFSSFRIKYNQSVLMPCAIQGDYDIYVQTKLMGINNTIKVLAEAVHPKATESQMGNRADRVNIRTQYRVRRGQMIVKWDKSKIDPHAMQYCLVISSQRAYTSFCDALNDYVISRSDRLRKTSTGDCLLSSTAVLESIWLRASERKRKIDPNIPTNVICSQSRTRLVLRGLSPNSVYFLDIFGIHTRQQNLTFHISSKNVTFERTHPIALRANALTIQKISGPHGVQVFSYKITTPLPPAPMKLLKSSSGGSGQQQQHHQLRYLVMPCEGSEVDAMVLKQRNKVSTVNGIYRLSYLKLSSVREGERYKLRFKPSSEDDVLKANRVGLAVTTTHYFSGLPELPENITVFELRPPQCQSATIAWYSSPEERPISYCVIVFNLPQRNRSSTDYTNYCMDFSRRSVQLHPLFHSMKCIERNINPPPLETHTIFNLLPENSYLVYVTVNLMTDGRPLPYQSLYIKLNTLCYSDFNESSEQLLYY